MEENFTAKKQLKDNYGFTDNDFEQIKSHGIALDKIVEQLRIFEDGIPKIILDRPAKIDDGILKLSKEEFYSYNLPECEYFKGERYLEAKTPLNQMMHFANYNLFEKDILKTLTSSEYDLEIKKIENNYKLIKIQIN